MGYNGNLNARATDVITTEGDLRRGDSSGNAERLAIGSANQVLQSNGTTESWATLSTADSVLTTQGDVLYESASGLARLGQSTDGFVLTTKGAGANPVWASVGGGGAWSVIGNYKSTSLDASKTFSSLAVDFDDYSEVVVVCDMANTANCDVEIRINAISSTKYFTDGWQIKDGTDTIIDRNSNTAWVIMPSALGQNNTWTCINHIQLSGVTGGGDNNPKCNTVGRAEGLNGGAYMVTSGLRSVETNIDSVEVIANGTTFQVGSRITVYKVARA